MKDPDVWPLIGSAFLALRVIGHLIHNVTIAHWALRGTKPAERKAILEGLAQLRQFSPFAGR